jgi:hypothetical protein
MPWLVAVLLRLITSGASRDGVVSLSMMEVLWVISAASVLLDAIFFG